MKKILLIIALLTIGSTTLTQAQFEPNTYNYTMGVTAFMSGDFEAANEYLMKEIEENSDNGHAYMLLSSIYFSYMSEDDKGFKYLKLAEKYIPKNDSITQSKINSMFSYYYIHIDNDIPKAIEYCNKGLLYNPSHTPLYEIRAYCYDQLGDMESATADMEKIVEYSPYSIEDILSVCEWYIRKDDYASALKHLEYIKCLVEEEDETRQYYEVLCNIHLNNHIQAVQDLAYLISEYNYTGHIDYLVREMGKADFKTIETYFKYIAEPNTDYNEYNLALARLYRSQRQYEKAIEYFETYLRSKTDNEIFIQIAECYTLLGNNEMALEYLNHYTMLNPDDLSALEERCIVLCYMGRYDEALELIDNNAKNSEEEMYDYIFNLFRFQVNLFKQDFVAALSNYDAIYEHQYIGVALSQKGRIYELMGDKKMAKATYKEAIKEYESSTQEADFSMCYAYIFMGKEKKALAMIEDLLANSDEEQMYNIACMYALMNDSENALKYLEEAIIYEETDKYWINIDFDLDNIRHLEEFKELINKYF